MDASIRVLSCGANGTGNSAVVSLLTTSKYAQETSVVSSCLVNCGDSAQKICGEQKIKLNTISCIVLSSLAPHNTSGLPGMLLSLSSLGLAEVTIIGPSGTSSLLHYMSPFTNRKYPELRIREVASSDESTIQLKHFTLRCRAILATQVFDLSFLCCNVLQASISSVGVACIVTLHANSQALSMMSFPIATAFQCYPLASSLIAWASQHAVRTVLCCALEYGILDMQSDAVQEIDEMMQEKELLCIASTVCLLLLLPYNISQGACNRDHYDFIYPHLFLNLMQQTCVSTLFPRSACSIDTRMREERFEEEENTVTYESMQPKELVVAVPLMRVDLIHASADDSGRQSILLPNNYREYIARKCVTNLKKYSLCTDTKINDNTLIEKVDTSKAVMEISTENVCNLSSARNLREQLRLKRKRIAEDAAPTDATHSIAAQNIHDAITVPPPSPLDPVITFFGTGCAAPSKYRSNSAVLMQLKGMDGEACSVLIDVGESAVSQMFLSYTDLDRLHNMLRSLRVVWISHHHADHHCGLPMLVEYISGIATTDTKIVIIAPESVIKYQEFVLCASGLDEWVKFVDISTIVRRQGGFDLARYTSNCVTGFSSVPVKHCHQSYGLVIHTWRGEKFVYSGDCRPSDSLVVAGMHCTLLIHEATFDDSHHDDAICKKHSTTSEAIEIATRMRAKSLILTHFSQRYPRSPILEGAQDSEKRIPYSVAYDFLRFAVPSQLQIIPEATRLVSEIFSRKDVQTVATDNVDTS